MDLTDFFFLSKTLNHFTFFDSLHNAVLLVTATVPELGSIGFSTDNKGHGVNEEFWSPQILLEHQRRGPQRLYYWMSDRESGRPGGPAGARLSSSRELCSLRRLLWVFSFTLLTCKRKTWVRNQLLLTPLFTQGEPGQGPNSQILSSLESNPPHSRGTQDSTSPC